MCVCVDGNGKSGPDWARGGGPDRRTGCHMLPQQRGSLAWGRGHLRARLGRPHRWLVIFILSPSLLLPPFLLPLLLLTTTAHPHLLSLFAPGQLAGEEVVVG